MLYPIWGSVVNLTFALVFKFIYIFFHMWYVVTLFILISSSCFLSCFLVQKLDKYAKPKPLNSKTVECVLSVDNRKSRKQFKLCSKGVVKFCFHKNVLVFGFIGLPSDIIQPAMWVLLGDYNRVYHFCEA